MNKSIGENVRMSKEVVTHQKNEQRPTLILGGQGKRCKTFSTIIRRGEEEVQRSGKALQNSGSDWTILRSSWFAQNFSEHFLLNPVLSGTIALPVGDVKEPFIDVEDIADVAVAVLTDDKQAGHTFESHPPDACGRAC